MKSKVITTLIVLVIILSMIPSNLCFAQNPEITREYIARRVQNVDSYEENLTAEYHSVQVMDGDYIKVTFLDGDGLVLAEYDIDLDIYELSGLNLSLNYDDLYGAEYIELKICGRNYVNNGVKLPFKIY